MGRGRQKAKHTKVARELKYFSPNTDYNALEAELQKKADGVGYGGPREDSVENPTNPEEEREVELDDER